MSESNKGCVDPAALCGCCEGTESVTPRSTANRPGLERLAYRIGTHSAFLETMLARLSTHCLGDREACARGEGARPLAGLTTRDGSDPSIALLDAWATLGDVLTFYQERIANEGYLRTATERRSLLELGRLVGYRPRPGVAASVYLAYTIDENTREEVVIPSGARVQSVPGPDELPQSFETGEELRARAAWNLLKPRQTQPQQWQTLLQTGQLYLKGIATNLKPGDPLLIDRGPGDPHLFRVTGVTAYPDSDRTQVTLEPWDSRMALEVDFEAVRKVSARLIASAPSGKTADRLVESLHAMSDVATRALSARELTGYVEGETLPLIRELGDSVRGPAPVLRSWLEEVEKGMSEIGEIVGRSSAAKRNVDDSVVPFSERLNRLIQKPSKPLANAQQLPRSLKANFRATGDAGLRTLGLASPDLQANLAAVIETYTRSSPENRLEVYALRLKAGVFGRNAPMRQKTISNRNETETETIGEWPIVKLAEEAVIEGPASFKVVAVHEKPMQLYLDNNYEGILPGTWLVLDSTAVPEFEVGSVLVEPAVFPEGHQAGDKFSKFLLARVKQVATKVARAEYGISGESVLIELDRDWLRLPTLGQSFDSDEGQGRIDQDYQVIRKTAVYARSEPLELAEAPIESALCGGADDDSPLELDSLYRDLEPGRFVIVSGERSDIADTTGVVASEALMITEVIHDVRRADAPVPLGDRSPAPALPGDRKHTFLRFDKPLSYCYLRKTVQVYGNVVKATHGETRRETLGNGDGGKPLQSFTLKQSPLTYLAAPTAVGAESALEVYVNEVRWHERESFVDTSPDDHLYILRTDDDEKTSLTFGNGLEGARLPSGSENVKAVYRSGTGKPGNVRAGQLSLLATRPLGVKEVINPLRASGGADRERGDQIRRNAPLAVMALDRLVSTRDYADFARGFAGIGKADATALSDGRRSLVHVTIAGADDVPIDTTSDLFRNLRQALADLGDPFQPARLAVRERLMLVISAQLRIDPEHQWEPVVTRLRARLLQRFGFASRELAQDVTASELLSVMQSVPGILYVDLDAFGAAPATIADTGAEEGRRPLTPEETAVEIARIVAGPVESRVRAERAALVDGVIRPARLAILVAEVEASLILNQIKD